MKISEKKLCNLCGRYSHLMNDYYTYLYAAKLTGLIERHLMEYEEKFKKSNFFMANESTSKFMKMGAEDRALGIDMAKRHLLESYNICKKDFPKSAFKHLAWISNIEKIFEENK